MRPSVNFDDSSFVVHEIEKVTSDRWFDVWYSKDEYDIIKARNSLIVKMKKAGQFQESEDHTFRGLEHKLKARFRDRRTNKHEALNAVLEMQDSAQSSEESKPERIAEVYLQMSRSALEIALGVGKVDAASAEGRSPTSSEEEKEESLEDEEEWTVASEIVHRKKNKIRRPVFRANRNRRRASM